MLFRSTSFDVPGNNVAQNASYDSFPIEGTPALPTSCDNSKQGLYSCPAGLGITLHSIGSPQQMQMSLRLDF